MALRKIAFILEDFVIGAPGQQLLDRFLVGYLRDGEFRQIPNLQVSVWLAPAAENSTAFADAARALALRQRDFQLVQHFDRPAALREADAVVVAAAGERASIGEDLLKSALEQMPAGATCFVHGAIAANLPNAKRMIALAGRRRIVLASATSTATTLRLPDTDVPANTVLTEALIVAQGPRPAAELSAIDALLPVIARRSGGESGIRSALLLEGRAVWRAGDRGDWSWPLLASAISRSNTTQGDPVRDGRTQDLVGLGMVKKLAARPRAWLVEHNDGLRSAILVLDGAIADLNFAVRSREGPTISAQLYRPPAPNRCEFDRLAGVIEDFFATRQAPWPVERSQIVSQFMNYVAT